MNKYERRKYIMKKILLIIGMICLLSSCTMMVDAVSLNAYDKAIENSKRGYAEMGYMEKGFNKTSKNELKAGDVVVHTKNGYTNSTQLMTNEQYIYNTYYFQDDLGNEFSFNTLLKLAEDDDVLLEVVLEGCVASNYKNYEKLCGDNSPVKRELYNIKPDTTVEVYDKKNTVALGVFLSMIGVFGCLAYIFY